MCGCGLDGATYTERCETAAPPCRMGPGSALRYRSSSPLCTTGAKEEYSVGEHTPGMLSSSLGARRAPGDVSLLMFKVPVECGGVDGCGVERR